MLAEANIGQAFGAMVRGIDVPPVPLTAILLRIAQPEPAPRRISRYLIPAAAVTALVAVAVPALSPAVVQSIQARIKLLLPQNSPPRPVTSAMRSQSASLATAQSRVSFRIVPPAGLPRDITSTTIATTPTAIYSKVTRSWHVGSPDVQFRYQRAGERSFVLIADRFDPHACPPAKYIFDADGTAPDGRRILVKREHFAWRNGDQIIQTSASEGISAPEIEAIRIAMRGIDLPRRATLTPCKGGTIKQIRLAAP